MSKKPALEKISNFVLKLRTKGELEDFFMGILTPDEIETIATRMEIVRMLKRNIPQQKIARQLKVGIATVTRGSRELKQGRLHHV
ncbi:transcriptional regulator [Candidatus Roizmanbacteria bacterium CG10_big_fil_rev_8_21_14_0_10_39_6]|uniref:Transcriptional regulator n=1 Tax=Candidatus Roizmanbacteria bacterium CG10_big_fil_rev_8_21_14_0_10_39_6 TaxID=1974853 RepID=A0A2M8KRE3_9BACT|nr:MAG: transcriptional regulator [Candidatus Roizmanbacteria bacterium CG10_big_fil_rev_8_21_14_0_10_39_6]